MKIARHTLPTARISRSARTLPIQIVVTPGSGNGAAMSTALELRDELSARRYGSSLEVFTDLDSLRRWATAPGDQFSLLICVGGDGTQSMTAMAAVRRSVPFMPVSSGFGNLFAQTFRHPSTVEGALSLLSRGRVIQADVGMRNGGEIFLCQQTYGLIAQVQEAVESRADAPRARWRRWLAYYQAALHHLRQEPPPRLRVTVDGRVVAIDAALVIAANVKAYGAWLPLTPDASPVDGAFDVFVMRGKSHLHVVAQLLRRHLRIPGGGAGMSLHRGRQVSVSGLRSVRDQLEVMPQGLPLVVSPEVVTALERDLDRLGDRRHLATSQAAA
jgi:diacylglycerol kinase family enzyme